MQDSQPPHVPSAFRGASPLLGLRWLVMDADLDTPDQGCLIVVVVLIGRAPSSIDGFGKLHGGAVAFFWPRHFVASRLAGSGYYSPGGHEFEYVKVHYLSESLYK
ncbi:hypothetical protein Goshw_003577, partial [Gossypium schwendimanii]|nr:hypothetical protein [Gossypium schwendimanii]